MCFISSLIILRMLLSSLKAAWNVNASPGLLLQRSLISPSVINKYKVCTELLSDLSLYRCVVNQLQSSSESDKPHDPLCEVIPHYDSTVSVQAYCKHLILNPLSIAVEQDHKACSWMSLCAGCAL